MKKFSEFLENTNIVSEELKIQNLNKDISPRDVRTILFNMDGRDSVYLNGKRMTAESARGILFKIDKQDDKTCNLMLYIEY